MRGLLAVALLGACTAKDDGEAPGPARPFPEGFHWGSATAGFQVDMGCPTLPDADCHDPASDWYRYVTDPVFQGDDGLFVTGETVNAGPGMWETLEDDVLLMKGDGLNAYRQSLEWSRLFPDDASSATSVEDLDALADPDATARYHAMFAAQAEAGIHPLVTLNHYTLPLWVHEPVACHEDLATCPKRGWVDEAILFHIALYAGWCAKEFGGEIDQWATLNEPFATALSGYAFPGKDRSAPPGVSTQVDATVSVLLHQIEGHAAMYDAVKRYDEVDADGDGESSRVGLVTNMTAIHPKDPTRELDVQGAAHADYLYVQLYLNALTNGDWDPDLDGEVDQVRDDLKGRLDYVGINYYNEMTVTGLPIRPFEQIPMFDFLPEFTWDPYPEGLGEVVDRAAQSGLPLVISENGTPYVEEEGVEVLDGHLSALHDAIERGATVEGYYYWSFIDNYEWNHGMDLRFGLYTFDPVTKERTPRAVVERYREIAEGNALGDR